MAASQGLFRRPAALSGADAAHRRRADELRVRARLCGAGAAEGAGRTQPARCRSAPTRTGSPAPTRSACPSRASSRSISRSERDAEPRRVRRAGASSLPQPLATVGHFEADRRKLRVAIPLPASVAVGEPYLFPITDNVVDYEAPQAFRRSGDSLVAELQAQGRRPAQFAGVLALGDGRGLEFHAVPGAVPQGGTPLGGARLERACYGRCSARLPAASSST